MTTKSFVASLIRPHAFGLFASACCMGIVSATLGLQVALVRLLLDRLLIGGERMWLVIIPIALIVVYGIHAVAEVGRGFFARKAAQGMMDALRVRAFEHIQHQSLEFFTRMDPGVLSERVLKDSESANIVVTLVITLLQKPLSLAILVGMAVWQAPRLTVIAFLGLPLVLLPMRWMRKRMKEEANRKLDADARLLGLLHEVHPSAETTRLFGLEDPSIARFADVSRAAYRSSLRAITAMLSLGPAVHMSAAVGASLIVYLGGKAVLDGQTTPGALMAFVVSLGLMNDPLKSLAQVPLLWTQARVGLERMTALLESPPAIKESPDAIDLQAEACTLAFHEVEFRLGDRRILEALSFRIGARDSVALIGETGAGKTTIVRLIPRLLEVTGGSITINGHDIRRLSLRSLRTHIAVVPQDPFLFEGTIEDNLRAGDSRLSEDEIRHAARLACADRFIHQLPEGYQTRVGSGGIRLSGGERQRLAIARAILRDAPIVLLDEPTSALDEATERTLQRNLEAWLKQRCVLIVSHRASVRAWAQRCLLLREGGIEAIQTFENEARGSHAR